MKSKFFKSAYSFILTTLMVTGILHSAAASDIMSIPFPPVPPGVTTQTYSAEVLSGNGAGQVAAITTDDFNAKDVDNDLLLIFNKRDILLTSFDTTASLVGETDNGVPFIGTDSIIIVR